VNTSSKTHNIGKEPSLHLLKCIEKTGVATSTDYKATLLSYIQHDRQVVCIRIRNRSTLSEHKMVSTATFRFGSMVDLARRPYPIDDLHRLIIEVQIERIL
jgi:hypothetical protein